MITPKDLETLFNELSAAKVINPDTTLASAIKAAAGSVALNEAIQAADQKGADGITPQWYIAGGSGYVLVIPH